MTRTILVGVAGAAIAGALYVWGPDLSLRLSQPIQTLVLHALFLPAMLCVQTVSPSTLWRLYACAAALWPSVAMGAILLKKLIGPQTWWGAGLLWVAPLAAATVATALMSDGILVAEQLTWLAGWSALAMAMARVVRREASRSGVEDPDRE